MNEYLVVRDGQGRPVSREMLVGLDPFGSILVLTNPKGGQIDLPIETGPNWQHDFSGITGDQGEPFTLVERAGQWFLQTPLPLNS